MPFDVKILSDKINGIKEAFENGRFADALIGSLNTGNALMQQRVFQRNADIEGNDFGKYIGTKRKLSEKKFKSLHSEASRTDKKRIKANKDLELTPWERRRVNKGRQIAKKDLEFSGGLRRAIETVVENEKAASLAFNNDEAAKIAHGQETQIANIRSGKKANTKGEGIKIFTFDEKERTEVTEQGLELIKQILKPTNNG